METIDAHVKKERKKEKKLASVHIDAVFPSASKKELVHRIMCKNFFRCS